jgi:hypothetical protein
MKFSMNGFRYSALITLILVATFRAAIRSADIAIRN